MILAKAATEDAEQLFCAMSVGAPSTAAGEFMYMAAGVQVINVTKGVPGQRGKDVQVNVMVDRSTAAALQAQLDSVNARTGDRAYFDFNHDDKEASFWPTQFTWRESPVAGVYVAGEWSEAGKKAISGKAYRSFSPVFHVDDDRKNPVRVIAYTNARPNMGGLVNNPAFKSNLPLWAKQAGAFQQKQKDKKMTAEQKATLQAHKATLEQEISALNALPSLDQEQATTLVAKQSELRTTNLEIELGAKDDEILAKDQMVLACRSRDADMCVQAAIKRGALQTQGEDNKALIASWTRMCTEDPKNIEILNKMPGSRILNPQAQASLQAYERPISIRSASISRESHSAVLGKMAELNSLAGSPQVSYQMRPQHAKSLAAIYAKEILPRLAEGDDIPLSGANSLGTLTTSLTAIRTLELLTLTFPLLKQIMTDFSDAIVSYGDTLTSRFVGIPTVQTYNTTTGWPTNSDATTTDVAITYNQYKGVPIIFQAHEINGTVRRLFEEIAPAQAYALGKDIIDYVYALITSAFTNTVTAAGLGTWGRSVLIDIGGILDDVGNPEMGRTFLANRPYYSALSKDPTIIQMAAFQNAGLITQGMNTSTLQDVEGFRVIKAVNLPATVISGATVLKGFGFTKSALALATRLSADYVNAIPGAGNGNLTVVTTPGGFSANLVQFVNHTSAFAAQRLEVIYGASRGQLAAGAILTDV